jgi:hypothetical protein
MAIRGHRNPQSATRDDFLSDPQLSTVLQGLNNLMDTSPTAKEVLFAQVIRDIGQLPLSPSRLQEIFAPYPDALTRFGEIGQTLTNPSNPVVGWTGSNFPFCWPNGWPIPVCGSPTRIQPN